VIEAFQAEYLSELITKEIERVASSSEYGQIKELCDIVSHRGAPPRRLTYGPPSLPGHGIMTTSATWEGLSLDATLTQSFRTIVATDLNRLFEVGRAFAAQQVAALIP
jgi:hypothetical protein